MALTVNRVTNANMYAEGNSLLGKVLEAEMPKIVSKTAEHTPLGAIGVVEYFAGFEKMEMTIKWASIYGDVLTLISDPFKYYNLQLRANVDMIDSNGLKDQVPYVVYVTAAFKEVPAGGFKQHENAELESTLSVTAVKIEMDGVEKLEFDALANIYKVDGVDKLAKYRANLGA